MVKIVQVCKFLCSSSSPGRHKAFAYARISVEKCFDGKECLYCYSLRRSIMLCIDCTFDFSEEPDKPRS